MWWASLSATNASSHLCIDKRAEKSEVTPNSWTIQLLGVFLVALGADCTLLGRSFIYALAAEGQQGVENLLDLYKQEMHVAMTLCGAKSVSELNLDSLAF